jgi:hypothetical protein
VKSCQKIVSNFVTPGKNLNRNNGAIVEKVGWCKRKRKISKKKLSKSCQKVVKKLSKSCFKLVKKLSKISSHLVKIKIKSFGAIVKKVQWCNSKKVNGKKKKKKKKKKIGIP